MGTPTFVPPRSTMKTFAGVLFLVLIVASYAQAASLTINQVEKTKIKPDLDICPLCISFMNSAINDLINIIMNAGVMGSCNELCSLLPNQIEATICDLLCAYVGIEGFMDLLNGVDPDPIWICEEITVCPVNPNAAANLTSFTVQPVHGKRQDTFTFDLTYLVTNEIGTGGGLWPSSTPRAWVWATRSSSTRRPPARTRCRSRCRRLRRSRRLSPTACTWPRSPSARARVARSTPTPSCCRWALPTSPSAVETQQQQLVGQHQCA